jgi:hypothetical protein
VSAQFGRVASLQVGTLAIEGGLAFEFDVKVDASGVPNKAEITVYNLSDSSRKSVETRKAPVILRAGYRDNEGVIFQGEVENAFTSYEGRDVATKINAADGARIAREARVSFSVTPGDTASSLLERAAEALGAGLGNLSEVLAKVASQPSLMPQGGAVHGSAYDQLRRLARAYGFSVSLQGGNLLFLEGGAIRKTSEVISPATGLIGSPKVDTKKRITFECLLRHSLAVGDSVKVESRFVSGWYRVVELQHKGHTYKTDAWTTSAVCDTPK